MSGAKVVAVIGGGAAGFFGAIACAEVSPNTRVIILEKTAQVLSKVRISGGGRCNVTHACFEPALLVKHYPRGSKELRGPYHSFQPRDTIEWFAQRGVSLKTEEDGRMFPTTDSSETIIECLKKAAEKAGVEVWLQQGVEEIEKEGAQWSLKLSSGKTLVADKVLIATGSTPKVYALLQKLGHTIVPLVPSLFTFNTPNSPFLDLSGVSVADTLISLPKWGLSYQGPLLFTHWGLSGPAILKLSAWGARDLHEAGYCAEVRINWVPSCPDLNAELEANKKTLAAKNIGTTPLFSLPKQLWKKLLEQGEIPEETRWALLSKKHKESLIAQLQKTSIKSEGKTTYKQEFVTAGGVALEEVNFKTMESRLQPGLHFAGEVLNIDGITGGFNFQNAWTTGWLAGRAI